jgi:hypothetical protein
MVVLDELAEVFHELADAHTRAELPLLVRAVGGLDDPDGFDVGVLALEGQHPGSALLGFTAPEDCTALGVVTTGWSLPPERFAEHDTARNRRAGSPAAEAPDRVAVFSTVVVGRGGDVAGRLSIDGDEPVTSAPESGVLLDLLLRALGCPTPSPAFGVLELLARAKRRHGSTPARSPAGSWARFRRCPIWPTPSPARSARRWPGGCDPPSTSGGCLRDTGR